MAVTNKKFAEENELFRFSCQAASLKPTTRQASKWRSGKGLATKFRAKGAELLSTEKKKGAKT